MNTTRTSLARRVLASASVLTLAATGLAGVAAHADEAPVGAQYGNIDTNLTGSITVHKRESGSQGATVGAVATETAVDSAVAVPGVTFTAYKLNEFQASNVGHWQAIQNLQVPATACNNAPTLNGYTFAAGKPFEATNQEGKATLRDLELGAYLICETNAPANVVKKALPFVVTVPFADTTTKGWVYHVHTYPKNTLQPIPVKTQNITANGLQTEDGLTYTIEAVVPRLAEKEHFTNFTLADTMIEEVTDIKIDGVTIEDGDASNKYTMVVDESKRFAAIHFNRAGLNELKSKATKKVTLTLKAKLNAVPANGQVPNKGFVVVDTTTADVPPADEPTVVVTPPDTIGNPPTVAGNIPPAQASNKVGSKWGQLKLKKKDKANDESGNQKGLKGAVYEVYLAAKQNGENLECTDTETTGTAITINGQKDFTSSEDGTVNIAGLLVAQATAAGTAEPDLSAAHRCYVVKEITAPAGYVLPAQPLTGVKVTGGATDGFDLELTNEKVTLPQLPLTGASGRVLMLIAGAVFVFLAVGGALVNRRRTAQN